MKKLISIYSFIVITSTLIYLSCEDGNQLPPSSPVNIPNAIKFNPNLKYDTLVDIDGNIYKTITIGKHTWMAENLRVTRFRNGDKIPYLKNNWEKVDIMGGNGNLGFCVYNNSNNKDSIAKYGLLYGFLAMQDERNIAPLGWHIATVFEWDEILSDTLLTFRGIEWTSSDDTDQMVVNKTGLTLLPSGYRDCNGNYGGRDGGRDDYYIVYLGKKNAYRYYIAKNSYWIAGGGQITRYGGYGYFGLSVRCVKDH